VIQETAFSITSIRTVDDVAFFVSDLNLWLLSAEYPNYSDNDMCRTMLPSHKALVVR
jgi:hypothetical protein